MMNQERVEKYLNAFTENIHNSGNWSYEEALEWTANLTSIQLSNANEAIKEGNTAEALVYFSELIEELTDIQAKSMETAEYDLFLKDSEHFNAIKHAMTGGDIE